jgi:hypothetical protein
MVVLILALPFSGCDLFRADSAPQDSEQSSLSTLTVNLAHQERTILPDAVRFTSFEVRFEPHAGQPPVPPQTINALDASLTATLSPGEWKIAATGYEGATALASGEKTVTLVRGAQTVTIAVVVPEAGQYGAFAYTIAGTLGADTAQLRLSRLGADADSFSMTPLNLLEEGAEADTIQVKSGFYELRTAVTKGGKTIGRFEAVHLYPDKTSSYTGNFPDSDFAVRTVQGRVTLMNNSGALPSAVFLYAATDPQYQQRVGSGRLELAEGAEGFLEGAWVLTLPAAISGETLYLQLESVNDEGSLSTLSGAGQLSVPLEDTEGIDLNDLLEAAQDSVFFTASTSGIAPGGLNLGDLATFVNLPPNAAISPYDETSHYQLVRGAAQSVILIINVTNPDFGLYSDYTWFIDGTETENSKQYKRVIEAEDYALGDHTVRVEVRNIITEECRDAVFHFTVLE